MRIPRAPTEGWVRIYAEDSTFWAWDASPRTGRVAPKAPGPHAGASGACWRAMTEISNTRLFKG